MNIVVCGNYGAGNIGDEMILEGMLLMLKNVAPKAKITVLGEKNKFPAGIRSFLRSLFIKNEAKKAVKECDYFILGGGGLFGNLTFRANIIWAIQAFQAHRYKKPVIMYGQSIGQPNGKFQKWLMKKAFKKAGFIAMRDQNSKTRLQELGIRKEIHVVPDLALRTSPKKYPPKKSREIIVALRHFKGVDREFIKNIIKFLNWLIIERKKLVKIIDFQEGTGADSILHKKIIRKVKGKERIKYFKKTKNQEELFKTFSEANIVLAMRLHSIITAIKAHTPFIAISYAEKVEDFLKDAELNDYMMTMEDVSFEKMMFLFNSIEKNHEKISSELEKFNKKAIKEHERMEKALKAYF